MGDLIPWSNLLPQYQSPQQMATSNANVQNTNASTGQIQAQTGLIGQQTQGADIANQGQQLSLDALKQAYSGGAPGAAAGGGSNVYGDVSGDDIAGQMQKNFAPIPTKPPPALAQQAYLLTIGGRPEAGKGLLDNYAIQVGGANQQRQLGANLAYQHAAEVGNADGYNFAMLNRYYPNQADMIKQAHPDATPGELNEYAKDTANHVAANVHQYSGRPADFQNGQLIDKPSGKPVAGVDQVFTGLNGEAKASAYKDANELVTVNNSDGSTSQVPRYKVAGFNSAEGFVLSADKAARSASTAAPQNGAPTSSGAPTTNLIAPSHASSSPPQQSATPPKANAAPAASPAVTDPVLKAALADPDFKLKSPPVVSGRTPTPGQVDQQKADVAAGQRLKGESDQAAAAAGQAQTYLQAARNILDSKGTMTGSYGGLIAKASALLGDFKGDASNYEELVKYLNNAGIAAAKGNYGSGLTEKELELQLTGASPSVDKQPGALSDLVNANLRQTKWTLDTANRVPQYVDAKNDPANFNKWNQRHFPQSVAVNAPTRPGQQDSGIVQTASGPNGAKLYLRGGQWVNK